MATEYATTYPDRVLALLLLSGVPAAAQRRWLASGDKTAPPTAITVGDGERYFGGPPAFEAARDAMGAGMFMFAGNHCDEDQAVGAAATRDALRRAHSV